MKKLTRLIIWIGLSALFCACGKKEKEPERAPEPVPVAEEVDDLSFKENMKSASSHVGEAAGDFKDTADQTARDVGSAFKSFGSQVGGAFKRAKEDLDD